MPQNDHDLLIRVDTKLDRASQDLTNLGQRVEEVRHDVSVLSDNMEVKIAAAVSGKANTVDIIEMKKDADKVHDDHERRLRFLERYVWGAIAVVAVGEFAVGIFLAFYLR
jgi:hypothetical protein